MYDFFVELEGNNNIFPHYIWNNVTYHHLNLGTCGQVDRALDSRSEGLGFDSQCWPCVEVSGKLCIPHCLGPPSRNGYLVHKFKVGSIVAGCRRCPLPGGR